MKILLTILVSTLFLFSATQQDDETKQAIVKIYTTMKVPNYIVPWSSTSSAATGSGAIIKGNRILTNAHVIANHTFIEVERYGQRKKYIAKVVAVSHQVDLAVLEVDDENFFKGVKPLELGNIPDIEEKIVVYGYPMGGRTLSATIGVVSRIESSRYSHSGETFLAIQIDAAINPGNSGGPALSKGKIIGVAMQIIKNSQNIGYLVPVPIIKHFLKDIEDGKYDGFADIGLTTQNLENPSLRKYYKLKDNTTGKLIINKVYNSSANGILNENDIITSIDGHKIENDGTVEFRTHEYCDFNYYMDLHQIGEEISLDIIRDGKKMKVKVPLKTKADDILLVETTRYDKMPTYHMLGGYVFSPLTKNLLMSTKANRTKLSYLASQWPTKEKNEIVVLLRVLASDISRGNTGFVMWPIEKINGETFRNFKEFSKKLDNIKTEFVIFEDVDGAKVIINVKEAKKKDKEIMERYNVDYTKSKDLRTKQKESKK